MMTAKMRTKIEQAKPEVISPTRERCQFGSHVSKKRRSNLYTKCRSTCMGGVYVE